MVMELNQCDGIKKGVSLQAAQLALPSLGSRPANMVIADPSRIIHRGLGSLASDYWPEAEMRFADSLQKLWDLLQVRPDLMIIEPLMFGNRFAEVKEKLLLFQPSVKILLYTQLQADCDLRKLMEGTKGLLSKTSNELEFVTAVDAIIDGGTFASPEVQWLLFESDSNRSGNR